MSAQGRITSQIMQSYCEQEPGFLLCRMVEGDLQWLGFTVFGTLIVVGVGSIIVDGGQKAVKNGTIKRLLSWSRFWLWFRKKENTARTSLMALIPTVMFIGTPLVTPLVWCLSVFAIYLYKNWRLESK